MRQLIFTTATVVFAGVSTGMAGPVISSATDAGGAAPPLSAIESGAGGPELELGGAGEGVINPALDPIDSSEVIGGTVILPPTGGGSTPPPLPAELPPVAPPALPPVLPIELPPAPVLLPVPPEFIGTGENIGIGGGAAPAGPGVTAVPLPLAGYAGLSLMLLLPVGRGMLRRVMSKSTEL